MAVTQNQDIRMRDDSPKVSADPHQALRDDVRTLGLWLGETLKKQIGEEFFEQVETVRLLAKRARGEKPGQSFLQLLKLLESLDAKQMLPLARAFSQFLTFANFAESHHRLRRRRAYELNPKSQPQPGSSEAVISELVAKGVDGKEIRRLLSEMKVDLVLTAHPTETVRRTLSQKYQGIAEDLMRRDRVDLTPAERAEIEESLKRRIAESWMTTDIRSRRPTPFEEAQGGLAIIEQVLWDAVPAYLRSLDQALARHTGLHLPLEATPVRFDSWMGGDRDGNPSVTPEQTIRSVYLARWLGAELYFKELSELTQELSMNVASAELLARVKSGESEPYRAFLRPLRERMRRTGFHYYHLAHGQTHPSEAAYQTQDNSDAKIFETRDELLSAFELCRRSLYETGAGVIAEGRLSDSIRRLYIFDLGLVRLDLRQESTRHAQLVSQLAKSQNVDYLTLDEKGRQEFLTSNLRAKEIKLSDAGLTLSDEDRDTLETFRAVAQLPSASLGAYIISMARAPSDILAVELLQKIAGVNQPLRVVPLFEQVEDLKAAGETLTQLFSVDWYQERMLRNGRGKVGKHGRTQEIMLGYSDSAKTSGRLAASWELYRAQETITEVCQKFSVKPTLFHGRGGSISRGGGPTFTAIQAQPPGSIQNTMRVTEQGEMILAKFGLPGLAIRNLELYSSALLEATLAPSPEPKPEWRAAMNEMAAVSEETFRKIVEGSVDFVPYFRQATPEQELALLNIGSRPARRALPGAKPQGLKSLRAIPWSFAWTQTRLHLPAWLGVDTALSLNSKTVNLELMRTMYRDWPFFKSMLDLFEMILAKSDVNIAARYDEVLVEKKLQPTGVDLRARLEKLEKSLLEVTTHSELLGSNAVLKRSIEVRNPYVDPLNLMQVELLRKLRATTVTELSDSDRHDLEQALLVTMTGIAAGMRNTG